MKRISAYATTALSIALLAVAGCTGHNDSDQNAQPGAAAPASTPSTPAATPPPPVSPAASTLPPASNASSPAPMPASTAAH
ncbi:hypothetical protein KK141_22375 [Dyella sp. LX-66]|uniref:hypothetical protein n=1 Tax=unclassified Dyella TaxID=2634549 RepID=UPI001BE051B2|nr:MULTISPECIES: hypothetical protein [unclassified Dyella]MBT2119831.1 hypothetical protein [Dyella sp. LX-1]MBT2142309.1 hypothetical protein [Dyella sp. LX-66]